MAQAQVNIAPSSKLQSDVFASSYNIELKAQLVHRIFGEQAFDEGNGIHLESFSAYLAYYARQCKYSFTEQESKRSHEDVLRALELLDTEDDKDTVITKVLETSLPPQHGVKKTVELAARIAVMHELNRWSGAGESSPAWKATQSLKQCLTERYTASTSAENVRIERSFNARALQRIAGFEIVWTDNLSRHLSIHDKGAKQTVHIFHHATFLRTMISSPRGHLLPHGLAAETLRSLALLFPQGDNRVKKWFTQQVSKEDFELDYAVLRCGPLTNEQRQIDKFSTWRDRLIVLKQEYDAAEPSTLIQWWYDTRRRVQWATFWIAALVLLLTIVFGCIQSVEGALQVYKAYYPT